MDECLYLVFNLYIGKSRSKAVVDHMNLIDNIVNVSSKVVEVVESQ